MQTHNISYMWIRAPMRASNIYTRDAGRHTPPLPGSQELSGC